MKLPHFQILTAFFCLTVAMGCGSGDDKAREAATAEALESIKTQPTKPPAPIVVAEPQDEPPKTGGTLDLSIANKSAQKGTDACVAITARGFKSIVSMQYSIKWDPKVLKFKGLQGFNLPGLSAENFGRHILDKGMLTYSWFDNNVKGINRGDGDKLYEICFEAIGAPGSKSAVQIVNAPTVIEIANVNSEFLTLDATPGMVLVK